MARLGYAFYPAATSNYSKGRERAIRYIAIHHSAGWENTLRYLWANPSRNGSSHFWVGNQPGQIEQYVDTADTAWTNGNWNSNNESITIETRGDWRGYYDQTTLDNLQKLIESILRVHPGLGIIYHKDVSTTVTLCPADLKDKGYALREYNEAIAALNPPTPTPPPAKITYQAITPKRVVLKVSANLWNFNFTDWSKAQAVKAHGQGSVIDVVAIATNALGGKYYMTAYSYNNGAIRATNGFNVADCEDYVAPPVVLPPAPEPDPVWEPMQTPRKMRLLSDEYVINLDTMQPTGSQLKAGTDIELVDKKTTKDNTVWSRSKWSHDNNKNWGIPLDRFGEVPTPTPAPEPEPEIPPEPPIDTDPDTPGNGDVPHEQLNLIIRILKAIANFFGIKWE